MLSSRGRSCQLSYELGSGQTLFIPHMPPPIHLYQRPKHPQRPTGHKNRSPNSRDKLSFQQILAHRHVPKETVSQGPDTDDLTQATGGNIGGIARLGLLTLTGFLAPGIPTSLAGRVEDLVDETQSTESEGHGGECETHAGPGKKSAFIGLVIAELGTAIGDGFWGETAEKLGDHSSSSSSSSGGGCSSVVVAIPWRQITADPPLRSDQIHRELSGTPSRTALSCHSGIRTFY